MGGVYLAGEYQMILWLLLAAILVLLLFGLGIHNRFVSLNQRADNAFSDVDVQLKRRWDLVNPLVEVVKGYAAHERDTLEEVIAARSRIKAAGQGTLDPDLRGKDEAELASALRGVFLLIEDYPALKADQSFLQLHQSLVKVEDDIQYSRRYFNAVVRDFNTLRQSIPSSFVGELTGVSLREFFQLEGQERAVPVVNLGLQQDGKS